MVATIFVAAGCANAADQDTKELTVKSVPSIASDLSSTPAVSVGPGMQRLVDIATRNLATKLGIEEADITVAQAEYVTWRDSSIGCPQPDMQYMQVLTNGSRIVLKANNGVYHYHSGGNRPPSYCAKPAPRKPLPYEYGET
jgi:hypothetical protein